MTKRLRQFGIAAAVALLVYLGSYVGLSFAGQYRASQTGLLRYSGGLSISDITHWQPALAYWEPFTDIAGSATSRGNLLGYLYCPLIVMDREWWHPSEPLLLE